MNKTYSAPHISVIMLEPSNSFMDISWGNIGGVTDQFDARTMYGWDEEDDLWDEE